MLPSSRAHGVPPGRQRSLWVRPAPEGPGGTRSAARDPWPGVATRTLGRSGVPGTFGPLPSRTQRLLTPPSVSLTKCSVRHAGGPAPRFAVLKGSVARLERAIMNLFVDTHTMHHGYTEANVPYIVGADALQAR